jgi:ATP-binding cassette subfamily B protein
VGENLSALQENITGVRVIQAYAREPEQTRRFRVINRELYDAHLYSVKVSTFAPRRDRRLPGVRAR